MLEKKIDIKQKIIGLVPAAGQATRLSPLPFSKELYPIGHMRAKDGDDWRPKPVCMYLFEKMKIAGVKDVFIIFRKGKWDIPGYLGDGSLLDMNFAYLMMNLPFGVPYTLNQAYPFVKDSIVTFGFPDILFEPADAYVGLLSRLSETAADVVLGAFPVSHHDKWDMIGMETDGKVCEVQIKPKKSNLRNAWIIAVWGPNFVQFLHEYVSNLLSRANQEDVLSEYSGNRELFLSQVIGEGIENGMHVQSVLFQNGECLDIGTATDLAKAVERHNILPG